MLAKAFNLTALLALVAGLFVVALTGCIPHEEKSAPFDAGTALLSVSSVNQDFGTIGVGGSSAPTIFVVTNTGNAASGPLSSFLGGLDASSFVIDANGCEGRALAPLAGCAVSVRFMPSSAGNKRATLTAVGAPGGTIETKLAGVAAAGGALAVQPSAKDFGSVAEGTTSVEGVFAVTNHGNGATGAIAMELQGSDKTHFMIVSDGCAGKSLLPGGSCAVTVLFKPTSVGPKTLTLVAQADPGGAASAALTGTAVGPSALQIVPGVHDFGGILQGTQSGVVTFAVKNTGASSAGVVAFSLAGANPGDFSIGATDCNASLGPNASCSVSVRFSPTSVGARSATLLAASNPGGGTTALLSGTGVAPAALSLTPGSQDFGSLVTDTSTADVTFVVRNLGGVVSGIPAISVAGADANHFVVAGSTCTAALAPNATCALQVHFHPTLAGARAATLNASATPGGSVTSALTGTALAPGQITISPVSNDFGSILVNSGTADFPFTVTNTGGVPTGAPAVSLTGTDASHFVLGANGCTAPIAAGAACTVRVSFMPTSAGAKSASLAVSGTPGGNASAALKGVGLVPATLSVVPNVQGFGQVLTGASSGDFRFTVTNGGSVPSGAATVSLGGADATQFSIASSACGVAIAAGASCDIVVRFGPTSTGGKNATLDVAATPGGVASAALSGTGLAPASLTISPPADDFGSVVLGQSSADVPFTVTNTGGVPSGVPGLSLTGADASQFVVVTNGCSAALAPSATCSIVAHFAPSTAGRKVATLGATASPGGTATASLSGTGLTPGALTISPLGNDYGPIVVGQSSADVTYTVLNSGGAPTGALTVSLGGTDRTEFALTSNGCGSSLAGGASCLLLVRFAPTTPGAKTVSLSVGALPGGSAASTLRGLALGPAQLSISPSPSDFGSIVVGTSTSDVTFTVSNTGGVATGAPTVSLGGNDPSQWVIASNGCGAPIAGGSSCFVTAHFSPTSASSKSASLTVSASPGGSASASLVGVGLAPAALTIAPSAHDYLGVVVGQTSGDFAFTVTNTGGAPSGVPSIAIAGPDGNQFVIATNGCASALAASASCIVSAHFAPTSPGAKNGSLVASATPGGGASSSLAGLGLLPANLTITPASGMDFGPSVVGVSTANTDFTIRNTGGVASGAITPSITGNDPSQFTIMANTCTTLAPGLTCSVSVRFLPTSTGPKTASFGVSANPGGSPAVALSGSGVAPAQLALSPGVNDYQLVVVSTSSADVTYTVTNTGGAPSGTITVALGGADPTQFIISSTTCGPSLGAGLSCSVLARFAPTTTGRRSASLTASATPGGSSSSTLTGTGVTPASLTLSPSGNDYGALLVGSTDADVTFTVTNTGGATSGVPVVALGGPDAAHFAITSTTCNAALAGGGACSILAHFAPTSPGTKNATLTANASPGGAASSALSGVGLAPASLTMAPNAHDYGAIAVGSSGTPFDFVVTNNGGVATGVLTTTTSLDFPIVADSCGGAALGAGASCTVRATFSPRAPGNAGAALTVSRGPAVSAQASLTGVGVTAAQLAFAPAGNDFLTVAVGQSSAPFPFTLTNNGGQASGVVTITLSNRTDFTITANTCVNLALAANGGTCSVSVQFNPTSRGPLGSVLGASASPGGNTTATLSGTGG